MTYDIRIERIYAPSKGEGDRVLVDRLWPRGKRKADLGGTEWYGDAAPSSGLRRAWHRGDLDAITFERAYLKEIEDAPACLVPLMRHARRGPLTLLTASKDPEHSHVPILRRVLLGALALEDREADGGEPSSPVCYDK